MAGLAPRRIPNVVFGLTLFWSCIGSAFFWDAGFNIKFLWPWLLAIAVGGCLGHFASATHKSDILERLRFRKGEVKSTADRGAFMNSNRGAFSTMGAVPFPYAPPLQIESYSFEDLLKHCPIELNHDQFSKLLGPFFGPTARSRSPATSSLFDGLIRVLMHSNHVARPAGIDRHGGRSLLTHSLLVCALMIHRAPGHTYVTNKVSAINSEFTLDALDPLIPIIGIAHDLGKLRTTIFDATGRPIAFDVGHESHNSRLMALVPEFWSQDLQVEDRRIIQCVLAYAGRVESTPVQKNDNLVLPVVTSDRLHALQGLLGQCDRLASSIEMGEKYDFSKAATPVENTAEKVSEAIELQDVSALMTSLAEFLCSQNTPNSNQKLFYKFTDAGFSLGKDLLIVDEPAFITAFSAFINRSDLDVREGKSSALTSRLLGILDDHTYLFRMEEAGGRRAAGTCLYKIDLSTSKGDEFNIPSSFLINITEWQGVQTLRSLPNDCLSATFGGSRFGGQGHGGAAPVAGKAAPKPKAKKEKSPDQIINAIGHAFVTKEIMLSTTDAYSIGVEGYDAFFKKLGIQVREYEKTPEELSKIGILKIKTSKNLQSSHVLLLDAAVYGKFVKNLSLF